MKGLKTLVLLIAVALIPACATGPKAPATEYNLILDKKPIDYGNCRQNALYAAMVAADKYPVRIVIGKTSVPGVGHAQAQIYKDGKWQWLIVPEWQPVYIGKQEQPFTDTLYLSIEEYETVLKTRKAAGLDGAKIGLPNALIQESIQKP